MLLFIISVEKTGVLSSFNTNSYDLTEQYVIQSKRTSEERQKYAISYCQKKKKRKKNAMADVTICFGLLFHFFEVALRT